jgi:solute carrier family 25 carnitine/acylcarnitine transporter 20/29
MSYREEISTIYEKEGYRGFTRGYSAMFLRDSPGFGVYFCLFEFLKRKMGVIDAERRLRHEHSLGHHYTMSFSLAVKKFICGGTAGCLTWTVCYPMDTVKSKMQTHQGPERLQLRKVIKETLRDHGLSRLYRGIHVQMLRAFPSTATSLLIYETVSGNLKRVRGWD